MSGRVWAWLASAGVLVMVGLAYFTWRAYLRFEVYYDRPQGEPEVFRFQVRLPPFVHFQWFRRPPEDKVRLQADPPREWAGVLTRGWAAVRELRVVERTLVSLFRHELSFLEADPSFKRGVRFGLQVLERVPWRTEELRWVTRVGTGDAALTGILSGLLWAFKGTVFGVLAERMTFARRPVVRVLPDFEAVAFRTTFRCIVGIRVWDIIRTGAGLGRRKRGAAWRTNTRLKA